jgi:hypothetical protein
VVVEAVCSELLSDVGFPCSVGKYREIALFEALRGARRGG